MTSTILKEAKSLPEGGVLSPKEFLHLGSRANVDQAFSRLARRGILTRVERGLYTVPTSGRFGVRPPAVSKVISSIAEKTGETIVPSGAAAANSLGLTTQVPVREMFLTSGRSRRLQVGNQTIEVTKARSWQLTLGSSRVGTAIRALSWAGPEQEKESIRQIRQQLTKTEWRKLRKSRARLPSWMAAAIGEESDAAV